MYKSTYLKNKELDHSLGVASWTKPTAVYLAAYTTDPTAENTGNEVTGGGYARKAISFNSASGGIIDSSADVLFNVATADLGTWSHWGILDAETDGNLLYFGPINRSVTLGGATSQFDISNPSGIVFRYTWDGTGTDPAITATNPTPGEIIYINAQNFNAANNGWFIVLNADTNYFEVENEDGVAELNKTVGTGSIEYKKDVTKTVEIDTEMKVPAGYIVIVEA